MNVKENTQKIVKSIWKIRHIKFIPFILTSQAEKNIWRQLVYVESHSTKRIDQVKSIFYRNLLLDKKALKID